MNEPSTPSINQKFPTFAPIFRWLVSWRTARWALIGVASLVTLIVLFYTVEYWRGKHAWNSYRAGKAMPPLASFFPPPVPDSENFAMTPFLAPLFDFSDQPDQRGQSRWRDTNGFQRAQHFGQHKWVTELFPEAGRAGWIDNEP